MKLQFIDDLSTLNKSVFVYYLEHSMLVLIKTSFAANLEPYNIQYLEQKLQLKTVIIYLHSKMFKSR